MICFSDSVRDFMIVFVINAACFAAMGVLTAREWL